jgi:hypothetical protein
MVGPEYIAWQPGVASDLRPALADFDLLRSCEDVEWSLLLSGEKPSAKLEDLDEEHLAWYMAHAAHKGVFCRPVTQDGAPSPEGRGFAAAGSRPLQTLFLSWNEHALDDLVAAEAAERGGGSDRGSAQERSGILLGYPRCCARFMAGLRRQEDDGVLATYRQEPGHWLLARNKLLNFLPPLVSPVTWYPCSLGCKASVDKAKHYMAALARSNHARADKIRSVLPGAVCVFSRFCFVHLHGVHFDGGWVRYSGVSDALSYTVQPSLTGSGRILAFRNEVTEVFARYRRVLFEPDRVVLRCGRGRERGGQLLKAPLLLRFPAVAGGGLL